MTVFLSPWGARCGALHREEAVPVPAKLLCSSQTALSAAQDGPFWDGLHPRASCQLCPAGWCVCEDAQQAPSDGLLRGKRMMCRSQLEDFKAFLGGGDQFQGPLKGKWKLHQFHVDSGSWRSEMHQSRKTEPCSCFTGDGGAVQQGLYHSQTWGLIIAPTIFYSALHTQRTNILTWTVPNFARLQQSARH